MVMNNEHQQLIGALRQALHRAKLQDRLAAVREKAAVEQAQAEVELFCDTLRQEGIDPLSAFGKLCIAAFIAKMEDRPLEVERW